MNETVIGRTPRVAMDPEQRRAHVRLARAEKRLIAYIVWEYPSSKIDKQEDKVRMLTEAWKQRCPR